jgi:hypothetical protein
MKRALLDQDGYFMALHSMDAPEPTEFVWREVDDAIGNGLSTHHLFIDGLWVYAGDRRTPAQIIADQWSSIRTDRNALLSASDWTQAPDSPVDKSAWAIYRQSLRDITNKSDPFSISWPTKP